eukprot:PhM_4_TR2988/c0_g1_i1/m.69338
MSSSLKDRLRELEAQQRDFEHTLLEARYVQHHDSLNRQQNMPHRIVLCLCFEMFSGEQLSQLCASKEDLALRERMYLMYDHVVRGLATARIPFVVLSSGMTTESIRVNSPYHTMQEFASQPQGTGYVSYSRSLYAPFHASFFMNELVTSTLYSSYTTSDAHVETVSMGYFPEGECLTLPMCHLKTRADWRMLLYWSKGDVADEDEGEKSVLDDADDPTVVASKALFRIEPLSNAILARSDDVLRSYIAQHALSTTPITEQQQQQGDDGNSDGGGGNKGETVPSKPNGLSCVVLDLNKHFSLDWFAEQTQNLIHFFLHPDSVGARSFRVVRYNMELVNEIIATHSNDVSTAGSVIPIPYCLSSVPVGGEGDDTSRLFLERILELRSKTAQGNARNGVSRVNKITSYKKRLWCVLCGAVFYKKRDDHLHAFHALVESMVRCLRGRPHLIHCKKDDADRNDGEGVVQNLEELVHEQDVLRSPANSYLLSGASQTLSAWELRLVHDDTMQFVWRTMVREIHAVLRRYGE